MDKFMIHLFLESMHCILSMREFSLQFARKYLIIIHGKI